MVSVTYRGYALIIRIQDSLKFYRKRSPRPMRRCGSGRIKRGRGRRREPANVVPEAAKKARCRPCAIKFCLFFTISRYIPPLWTQFNMSRSKANENLHKLTLILYRTSVSLALCPVENFRHLMSC